MEVNAELVAVVEGGQARKHLDARPARRPHLLVVLRRGGRLAVGAGLREAQFLEMARQVLLLLSELA